MRSFFVLFLSVIALVNCTNVWVSTTGSDNNPGTPSLPVQTVSHAYSMLKSTGPSGQNNIYVQAGTYGYDSILSLIPINANFVAQGGTVVFSCENENGSFVSWGSSSIQYYWYSTKFSGIVFQECNNGVISLETMSSTNSGGMNYVFSSVDFAGSVYFACSGFNINCNVTMSGVDWMNTDVALTVQGALGVAVDSSSITGASYALVIDDVTSFIWTDSSISSCDATMSAMLFNGVTSVYFGNVQINSNSYDATLLTATNVINATFNNVQIYNNSGYPGESVLLNFISTTVNWIDVGVQANSASQVIQFYTSKGVWNDVQVQDNVASLYTISVDESSVLTMTNTQIIGNSAVYGGAVSVMSSTLEASYCTFNGNAASLYGGALYSVDSIVSFSDLTISDNDANTAGAAYCSESTFSDPQCNYENNVSYDGSNALQC